MAVCFIESVGYSTTGSAADFDSVYERSIRSIPAKKGVKMQLLHGDCLELMKDIPDNSVDMVLCDLPFGVTRNEWDKIIPFDALWGGYHRIVKPNGAIVLHCQQPFTSQLIMSNLSDFKYCWVWYKKQCSGFLNAKKQPLRNCEDITVFYRKQCTYNPIMRKVSRS